MALISTVEEVVAHDVQAHQPAIVHAYVGTGREVNQCVRRCSRFGVVVGVEMVLPQVRFNAESKKQIVEQSAVADKVVAHVGVPSWGWREGQILAVGRLVQLNAVDI